MTCLSSVALPSYSTYLSNPLHFIFGLNMNSEIECTKGRYKTNKENFELIWSIPIVSYSNLEEVITAFCSAQPLDDENAIDCSKCETYVPALQHLQLINISPVIFIHLKRFIYDIRAKLTRKLKHSISYPELLDLSPYLCKKTFVFQ